MHELIRCPGCGSLVPDGTGPMFCPVCVMSGEEEPEEATGDGAGTGRMGRYLLLEEIARGGMGVVYRARQDGLHRVVAIKVLPGAAFAAPEFRRRFQREAETAARLAHPGIVRIHEIGEAAGQPFISMEFIEGPSLAELLERQRMPPASAADLVRQVALAAEHAHGHGVAHRDLKPSNIVMNADNQPVLTDFGLARFFDRLNPHEATLDSMGSPAYLPPERVEISREENPVAEDVYGLGAILYHCLTDRPPYVADSLHALLSALADGELIRPRLLNRSVPADLETICLKCLETSPGSRYRTAAAVADDLDRFLKGHPILARPSGPVAHVLRAIRRKPAVASLAVALLGAIAIGTLVSLAGWRRAIHSADLALSLAEGRRVNLYSGNMAAASAAYDAGNPSQLRNLLRECLPAPGETDLRGAEWFLLDQLAKSGESFSCQAHGHILTSLAWKPAGDELLTAAHDGSLRRWKLLENGTLEPEAGILPAGGARIHQILWLPDGSGFITAERNVVRCRKIGRSQPVWEIPGSQFSLTSDGAVLAISQGSPFFYQPSGPASLWHTGADLLRMPSLDRQVHPQARAVALSPDGRWLAFALSRQNSGDDEHDVLLEDLIGSGAAPRLLTTEAGIWSLAFSPDSAELVVMTRSGDGRVLCFNTADGTRRALQGKHAARVWSACFTGDSTEFLTTSSDRSLRVWPLDGSGSQSLPMAHDSEIWTASIDPGGNWLASGDKDGILKLHRWPLPQERIAGFPSHPHYRYSMPVFTPDSSRVLVWESAGGWRTGRWNPADDSHEPVNLPVYPKGILPDGAAVMLDAKSCQVKIMNDGKAPLLLDMPMDAVSGVNARDKGISPDFGFVFSFARSGHAARLDIQSGSVVEIEGFCMADPTACALSPGGRFLAAATWTELIVHDFTTRKTTRLSNDPHWAKTIVFSPDGKRMITGGVDGQIHIRSLPGDVIVGKLTGHLAEVSGLAVSPDGRTLVSSEIGIGLRFWRLDTMREVLRLPLPDVCEAMKFSADGRSLAVTLCRPASPPTEGRVVVLPCPRE